MFFHRYNNLDTFFVRFVTMHAFGRWRDRQNSHRWDHVSIPCSAVKIGDHIVRLRTECDLSPVFEGAGGDIHEILEFGGANVERR